MKLKSRLRGAAIGAGALFLTAPAFAAFDYSVSYSDTNSSATYPASTTITTTNPLTFFTVNPGGSATGSAAPSTIGLFTLTPVSTALSGSGASTVTDTHFSDVVSVQTVANLDGSGPIGAPATFTITGEITGTLGPDTDNTSILGISGLPTSVTAGGVTYDLSLNSVRNPGVVSVGTGNTGGVSLTIAAVPEPGTFSLIGLGAIGLLRRPRRK
jgi:hypothetical protein